mmetsp:Transcript_29645/g.60531  ORF Transcript_29645/g.60531 Transcript_29645/m.60531 type:complete len:285 (-) Transcript_29645:112-966(-)
MFGPISRLRLLGAICPCLEKEEDRVAREALTSLSYLPIRWHRKAPKSEASSVVGGIVSGLFGGGAGVSSGGSSAEEIRASLAVADHTISGPALFVEPSELEEPPGDSDGLVESSLHRRKAFPLKLVGEVAADDGGFFGVGGTGSGVALYRKGSSHGNRGEALLRFDVLHEGGECVDSDRRDHVVQKLNLLIQWNKNRRSALGEVDMNDDTEHLENEEPTEDVEGNPKKKTGILRGHAAKAAHFAKREIEMQQMRREREKRKARYLKEAGGLKYTAVAMANKELS